MPRIEAKISSISHNFFIDGPFSENRGRFCFYFASEARFRQIRSNFFVYFTYCAA